MPKNNDLPAMIHMYGLMKNADTKEQAVSDMSAYARSHGIKLSNKVYEGAWDYHQVKKLY